MDPVALVPRRLFGFDYFISYAQSDASHYALALQRELTERGFICFIDRRENPVGQRLNQGIRHALQKSSSLILVGSPAALVSQYVLEELTTFSGFRRKILPVDVGRTLAGVPGGHALRKILKDTVWTNEAPQRLAAGPSLNVLEDLQNAFDYERESNKRIRFLRRVAIALAVLLAMAIGLGLLADNRRKAAILERDQADARRLALEARSTPAEQPQLRMLLAAEAVRKTWEKHDLVVVSAENELREARRLIRGESRFRLPGGWTAADYHPDGSLAVIANGTGEVRLVDLEAAGTPERPLEKHSNIVADARFVDDGRAVLSVDLFGTVRLEPLDGSPASTVLHEQGLTRAAALDPNRGWLAIGSSEGPIRVWDLHTENEPTVLSAHTRSVEALEITGSRFLWSASMDGRVLRWDLERRESIPREIVSYAQGARSLAAGESLLASGGVDGVVHVIDPRDPEPTVARELDSGLVLIEALAFSHDDRWLAAGSGDFQIVLWDLTSDSRVPHRLLRGHEAEILALRFSPPADLLESVSLDGEFRRWDLAIPSRFEEPRLIRTKRDETNFIANTERDRFVIGGLPGETSLLKVEGRALKEIPTPDLTEPVAWGWSRDERWLLVSDMTTAKIVLLDLTATPPAPTWLSRDGLKGELWAGAVSDSGTWVALGDEVGSLVLWHLGSDPPAASILEGHERGLLELHFSAEDHQLVSSSHGGAIAWSLPDMEPAPTLLEEHEARIRSLALDPGGNRLATGDVDGGVVLWDLRSWPPSLLQRFVDPERSEVYTLEMSPDGRFLAAGGQSTGVRLWEIGTEALDSKPTIFRHPSGGIGSLSFSPDSRWLASGSHFDESVRVWDLAAANPALEPRIFTGHVNSVWKVALGDKILVSGETSFGIRLWQRSIDALLAEARRPLGRDFDPQEWERFFPDQPFAPSETSQNPP